MDDVQKTVVHSFEFDGYIIKIVALDYDDGFGQCYYYYIWESTGQNTISIASMGDREYWNEAAAISAAFGDLALGFNLDVMYD